MTAERRTDDRRRRVLFSTRGPHAVAGQDSSSKEHDEHRAARRPQEAYGSRVKRRLRSRWFSLIPIHRGRLLSMIGVSLGLSLLLCLGHYYTGHSDFLLEHSEIARPFKLDQPNGFGQFLLICFTICSLGASLMIYQLRRYRNDDYGGRYRIWRVVIFALILHSIHLTVDLIAWSGAVIDAAVGQRILISGDDWARLLVEIGSFTLAIRLFLELRVNRYAASAAVIATSLLSFSEVSVWRPEAVTSTSLWMLATSSQLLGLNAFFIAVLIFLRQIYREVRQIDSIGIARSQPQKAERTDSKEEPEADRERCITDQSSKSKTAISAVWSFLILPLTAIKRIFKRTPVESPSSATLGQETHSQSNPNNIPPPKADSGDALKQTSQAKRSKWLLRGRSTSQVVAEAEQADTATKSSNSEPEPSVEPPPTKVAKDHSGEPSQSSPNPSKKSPSSDGEAITDWKGMSKSERRRLRKQLKRQKRAA